MLDLRSLAWSEPSLTSAPERPIRGRLGAAACVLDERTVLFLGGSARAEHLDETLLLRLRDADDGCADGRADGRLGLMRASLEHLEIVSAAGQRRPFARAHGVALWLPPFVLHTGGVAADGTPADGTPADGLSLIHI